MDNKITRAARRAAGLPEEPPEGNQQRKAAGLPPEKEPGNMTLEDTEDIARKAAGLPPKKEKKP